jgi:biotin carboxylase
VKSLVILGAGDGSLPTYVAAHRLGHHVIGVDQYDGAVGVPLADEFLHVSTTDPEKIADALGDRTDIAGIVAPSSDIALPTLQWLSRKYGVPEPAAPVVLASIDKAYFHRLCAQAALARYRMVDGTTVTELMDKSADLRLPLIVKPTDAAGSRGIRLCDDRASLPPAIQLALDQSPSGAVVIEERVNGGHHTLEGFVVGGQIAFAAITTRTITSPPYLVTTTHHVPNDLAPDVSTRIIEMTQSACERLGYGTGPVDVDMVVEPDGAVHLIEIGARVGGSGLTELIRFAYGVDLVEASINAAIGLPVDLEPVHPQRYGCLSILRTDRGGVLAGIRGEDATRRLPGVAELCLVVPVGREVKPYQYAAAKLGYAVLVADRRTDLAEAETALDKTLQFDISSEGSQ